MYTSGHMKIGMNLKVLSSEMDPAEIRLIRQIFIKGSVMGAFYKNPPTPHPPRALQSIRALFVFYLLIIQQFR
jgi:hypothetical protein